MSLEQLLKTNISPKSLELFYPEGNIPIEKNEVSEERVQQTLKTLRDRIAFYREYPDIFVDDMKGPECGFRFRPIQRLFLRSCMRHRYVYCVFTRGFSKSFLAIMALMLKAILFPGSKLFVTTGGEFKKLI